MRVEARPPFSDPVVPRTPPPPTDRAGPVWRVLRYPIKYAGFVLIVMVMTSILFYCGGGIG